MVALKKILQLRHNLKRVIRIPVNYFIWLQINRIMFKFHTNRKIENTIFIWLILQESVVKFSVCRKKIILPILCTKNGHNSTGFEANISVPRQSRLENLIFFSPRRSFSLSEKLRLFASWGTKSGPAKNPQ